ncbi:hypothetical protein EDB89DRAFT_2072467 [Lactarius sanguifluus]|nr:hypothetical protein EDB89DRAFT_2072467 [Lactarius sanguifluus]
MSTASQNVLPLSLPGATSHRPSNGLNIAQDRPSLQKRKNLRTQGKCYGNATMINALTDNALVEIFDFCRKDHIQCSSRPVWKWHLLVHVCRRWRQIIFASPRRLHLEILCTDGTPVRKNLGVWPAIPIVIQYNLYDWDATTPDDEDNVIAALEHPDRVCRVRLHVTGSQLRRIATVMQTPFPVLTCLSISSEDANVPLIPSGFLAGSAPCLREIEFTSVPFPALPTIRLSVSGLVELRLCNIPKTNYISPEVMVALLAAFPQLQTLHIGFLSPDFPRNRILLPPTTRTVLPALNHFSCVCDYLEDFVARIDAPQLRSVEIYYLDHQVLLNFEFKQLSEFINRSENLKRTLSGHCQIIVDDIEDAVNCYIGGTIGDKVERRGPKTGIYIYLQCDWMEQRILHLTRVLSQISPVLSDIIIHFAINSERSKPSSRSSLANLNFFEWLDLIRPFPSVQTLFVAAIFAGHVSFVLRDTARLRIGEVLPALDLLCLEDQPVSFVHEFMAVRRYSGHPVTVVNTKKEFENRLEAYPP